MGFQMQKPLNSRLPVYTLFILATSVLAYTLPGVASLLIFDRLAILNGEAWRVLSGHTVHFSSTHFVYDLLAFGLAGGVIEYKRYPGCGVLYVVMAFSIGVSLLVFKPGMDYYGGLSGLACGAVVYLALFGLHGTPTLRLVSVMVLVLVVSKVAFELYTGQSVLLSNRQEPFISMPISHLVGVLSASSVFFYVGYHTRRRMVNARIGKCFAGVNHQKYVSTNFPGSGGCIEEKA